MSPQLCLYSLFHPPYPHPDTEMKAFRPALFYHWNYTSISLQSLIH